MSVRHERHVVILACLLAILAAVAFTDRKPVDHRTPHQISVDACVARAEGAGIQSHAIAVRSCEASVTALEEQRGAK